MTRGWPGTVLTSKGTVPPCPARRAGQVRRGEPGGPQPTDPRHVPGGEVGLGASREVGVAGRGLDSRILPT